MGAAKWTVSRAVDPLSKISSGPRDLPSLPFYLLLSLMYGMNIGSSFSPYYPQARTRKPRNTDAG